MKPITYDFDVITDAPAPQRRAPQPAEQPPQPDTEEERRGAVSLEERKRNQIRAAE